MKGGTGFVLGIVATVLAGAGIWQFGGDRVRDPVRDWVCDCPGPLTVARATLVEARQEEKLLVRTIRFDARSVAEQPLLDARPAIVPELMWSFLSGRKTLLVPVEVGYAVDLSAIEEADLDWDDATQTLTVLRPAVVPQPPQPDARGARFEVSNGLVIWWNGAEARVDQAVLAGALNNAAKGAAAPRPIAAAERDANAVLARTFRQPLHAAGFSDARVVVKRKDP